MAQFSPTVVEARDGEWNVVDSATGGKFLAGPYSSLQAATDASVSIATLSNTDDKPSTPPYDNSAVVNVDSDGIAYNSSGKVVDPDAIGLQSNAITKGDDHGGATLNKTQQIVNSTFNGVITPQPNVLSDYASYTYQMTWYLMTPEQYSSFTMGIKNVAGWQILMQSGGAGQGTSASMGDNYGSFMDSLLGTNSSSQGNMTGVRNKYFNLDYYMDDFEITSANPGKGTGMCHSVTDITFTVSEPMGITLIDNLYKAVSDLYKSTNGGKKTNYVVAYYCLGIRFYGYDAQGNLTKVGKSGNVNGGSNFTDSKAIVEKFYPFLLKNITFRVTTAGVKYKVECTPQAMFYNVSSDRGTVPFPLELTGQTVKDILVGGGKGVIGDNKPKESTKTAGRKTTPAPKDAPKPPPPRGVSDDFNNVFQYG